MKIRILATRALACAAVAALSSGCVMTTTVKRKADQPDVEPVAWGVTSETPHCVIFKENIKQRAGFYVVAMTAQKFGELEVVEAIDYTLEQTLWPQTQESIDELQRIAQSDGVRFVKIPDQYRPSELNAARDICRETTLR